MSIRSVQQTRTGVQDFIWGEISERSGSSYWPRPKAPAPTHLAGGVFPVVVESDCFTQWFSDMSVIESYADSEESERLIIIESIILPQDCNSVSSFEPTL